MISWAHTSTKGQFMEAFGSSLELDFFSKGKFAVEQSRKEKFAKREQPVGGQNENRNPKST